MLTRINSLLCTLLLSFSASSAVAQTTLAEFEKTLEAKAAFRQTDFAALKLGGEHEFTPLSPFLKVSNAVVPRIESLLHMHSSFRVP